MKKDSWKNKYKIKKKCMVKIKKVFIFVRLPISVQSHGQEKGPKGAAVM